MRTMEETQIAIRPGQTSGTVVVNQRLSGFLNRLLAHMEYRGMCLLGHAFGISVVVRYLRNPNPLTSVRLLRAFGANVGAATTIKGSLFLDNAAGDRNATGDFSHLHIGDNCYIGEAVFFDLANEVVIEDNAVVAGRASFLTHAECGRSRDLCLAFPRRCARISVGDGAWVGFGATVLCGVVVGKSTVLGAGSLLLQDAEPHSVYAGNPAKRIKRIN